MANVERDNNMMNEEQESSQSNSSNGSGATPQQNQSSFQLKSSILRQPATFGSGAGAGGGLFGSSSTSSATGFNLKPSVLKPSHFGGSAFQNNSSGSNSFGSNPFLKTQQSEDDPESVAAGQQAETSSEGTAKNDKEEGGSSDPLAALNRSTLPKSNLFANVKSISENKGFVFGQNVHERVTGGENIDVSATPTAGLSFSSAVATTTAATNNSNDSSSSNSTTPASTAAGAGATGSNGEKSDSTGGGAEESLEEAARRYEESRGALKRKFDEVETITGEEDERNVAELNCKLFAFAKSNWEERGHGTLRLNDKDGSKESRVVFRQAGNLRVLINTKVWSGMIADQSSQKSLRLTAMDNNGQVKVFLVMSRPDLIGKLHKDLTKRIQTAKELAAAAGEDDDSKENNDENVSSAAAVKPSEDDDHAHATPPVVVVVEKDPGSGDGDEPPSAKKRLSAAASP